MAFSISLSSPPSSDPLHLLLPPSTGERLEREIEPEEIESESESEEKEGEGLVCSTIYTVECVCVWGSVIWACIGEPFLLQKERNKEGEKLGTEKESGR